MRLRKSVLPQLEGFGRAPKRLISYAFTRLDAFDGLDVDSRFMSKRKLLPVI